MTTLDQQQECAYIEQRFLDRNAAFESFFEREAPRIAEASCAMADRFLKGGRLLAFGRGAQGTDAQHVSVEFVHPVIVGKRALPALDLSSMFGPWLEAIARSEDIVMGFAPPEGDAEVQTALTRAASRGAMTISLPGDVGDYSCGTGVTCPFAHQELIELLYHTLWETVHVFLEHQELGFDAGEAGFLYPFLGRAKQDTSNLLADVASSIRSKAAEDSRLRIEVARDASQQMLDAVRAIDQRLRRGGKVILFGNGGSATDANDFAMDCVCPPPGYPSIPAISLSLEPANLTAAANDVGVEVMFVRQLIAHARREDVAIGISTSGGSRNIIAALEEARKRGLLTIALLGNDGGEIVRRKLADIAIVVRCDYIPRIQEVQASVYHVMRQLLGDLRHA